MGEVQAEIEGALGRIRLNRPKAINALTLDMVEAITAALEAFAAAPGVAAVLMTGEGERGLCAGGDIRALYAHGRDGSGFGQKFFRAEYRMNARIADYPKPYIAIMDGITMGGGVGVSAHGSLRIVTGRTRLAMPETGIGFFPDIGATWLLARAPGELGTYLGLTGEAIGGADAILAGLADVLVDADQLDALAAILRDLPLEGTRAAMRTRVQTLAQHAVPPLGPHRAEIDAAFAHESVEEIFAALERSGSEFARKTLAVLAQKSPTSLKLTLRLLRAARQSASLRECLEREFVASAQVLASDAFYEGVRAAVIDKDRNPKWHPATLAEVTPEMLAPYYMPRGAGLFENGGT